jgi:hypothetical protein
MTGLAKLLAVSAVVMSLSYTITKERLFAPLRQRLGGPETFFGYLFSCPYCISHWLAFLLVPLTGSYYIDVALVGWPGALLEWFLSSILVAVVAAFLRVLFFCIDETQGLIRREQKKTEQETASARLLGEKILGGERGEPPPGLH